MYVYKYRLWIRKRTILASKGKCNISDMFPIIPCNKPELSSKFYKDPVLHFSTLLPTDKLAKQGEWLHNLRRSAQVITIEITALSMPFQ